MIKKLLDCLKTSFRLVLLNVNHFKRSLILYWMRREVSEIPYSVDVASSMLWQSFPRHLLCQYKSDLISQILCFIPLVSEHMLETTSRQRG